MDNWLELEIIAQRTNDPEYLEERRKAFIKKVKHFDFDYFKWLGPKGDIYYIMWYDKDRESVILDYDKEYYFPKSKLFSTRISIPSIPAYKDNYELFWNDLFEETVLTARLTHCVFPLNFWAKKSEEIVPIQEEVVLTQDELLRDLAIKLQEIEVIIKQLATVNNVKEDKGND